MNLDRSRVEREGFDLDTHDLFDLQLLEDAIQNAALGQAIHARINAVPVAKSRRKTTPFAALLGNIQNGVEHFEVLKFHVSALNRQAVLDFFVLRGGKFYCFNYSNLVLTRPNYIKKAASYVFCNDNSIVLILRISFPFDIPIFDSTNQMAFICTTKHYFDFIPRRRL